MVAAAFIAPITCLLTYSAGRRADTLAALRRTRAELAGAEITDDGPADVAEPTAAGVPALSAGPNGRAAAIRATAPFGGSGLVGLAERVRGLGGELAAGAVEPRGFRLRVVVPLHGRP